jgi:uncharacterized delta-60 repeat protein
MSHKRSARRRLDFETLEARQLLNIGPTEGIEGTVFQDLNGNGVRDANEPGIADCTVFLDVNDNGQTDPGEYDAVTDSDGAYSFRGWGSLRGRYDVTVLLPNGWKQTSPVLVPVSLRRLGPSDEGQQWNGDVYASGVSAIGRFALLSAKATNLVPNDTNGKQDIFRYNLQTNAIQRVSLGYDGAEPNEDCFGQAISDDGQIIAFRSRSTNLVPGTTTSVDRLYVYDCQTGVLRCAGQLSVSASPSDLYYGGVAQLSGNGQYLAFGSEVGLTSDDTNGISDVYCYDVQTGALKCITAGCDDAFANGPSWIGGVSGNGRYMAFSSRASNLVPNDWNDRSDIFVYDRETRELERVSISNDGEEGNGTSDRPTISSDSRYVLYSSLASNMVPGDTNESQDLFLYDRLSHTTQRVTVTTHGNQANGHTETHWISADGGTILISSRATNLVPNDSNGAEEPFLVTIPRGAVGGRRLDIAEGQWVMGADFGCQPIPQALATVEGDVWDDKNGNGVREPGERGVESAVIYLDIDRSGTRDPDEPSVSTTRDDPNTPNVDEGGHYVFRGLPSGICRIVCEPGWPWHGARQGSLIREVTVAGDQVLRGQGFATEAIFDLGDAPVSYSLGTAQHRLGSGLYLGRSVDGDESGPAVWDGLGDDHDGNDDDDGVVFRTPLIYGQKATVEVTASGDGILSAWVNYYAEGHGPSQHVLVDVPLHRGANVLSMAIPDDVFATGQAFVRFRLSSTPGLTVASPAEDGEVEDYAVSIAPPAGIIRGYVRLEEQFSHEHPDAYTLSVNMMSVYLDQNANGRYDSGERSVNTTGFYSFDGLTPGTYRVAVLSGAGWQVTSPASGSHIVQLTADSGVSNVNFTKRQEWDLGDAPDPLFPTQPASPGTFDPTFGNVGTTVLHLGAGANDEGVNRMAVDRDGKILAVGYVAHQCGVARLLPDGSLDPSFSDDGFLVLLGYEPDSVILPLADGKILVGSVRTNQCGIRLVRLNHDGTVDRTFGHNGEAVLPTPGIPEIKDAVLEPDGDIVVAAYDSTAPSRSWLLARFRPEGVLDSSFGNRGVVVTEFSDFLETPWGGSPACLTILPDGKLLAGGTRGTMARYLPHGELDPTFGEGGKVVFTGDESIRRLLPLADGKILALCTDSDWPTLIRLNADGSLDTTFGDQGGITDISVNKAADVALDPQGGTLVFTGSTGIEWVSPEGKVYDLISSGWAPGYVSVLDVVNAFPPSMPTMALVTGSMGDTGGEGKGCGWPFARFRVLDGASHVILPWLYLGHGVDADLAAPDSNLAQGDDRTGTDDEDGVRFASPMQQGRLAGVEITASASGYLSAWVDFDGDGDWADPGERIFADEPLTAGVNARSFPVPADAAFGKNLYARFRFSRATGLSYYGPAPDGEVEDYAFEILPSPTEMRDLGPIGYQEIVETREPGDVAWYHLQASRAGLLVIETAAAVTKSEVSLELFGSDNTSLAASADVFGKQRVEVTVPGPGDYYLRVSGASASIHLRAANQVEYTGSRMNVFDTDNADAVHFDAEARQFVVNGIPYMPAPNVSLAILAGGNGDSLQIHGNPQTSESLLATESVTIFSGRAFTLRADGFRNVVASGSSNGSAYLHGSSRGGETFSTQPYAKTSLVGEGYRLEVSGFGRISAFSEGGDDTANFNLPAFDRNYFRFDATTLVAGLSNPGATYAHLATGFRHINARAAANDDTVILDDSPGDDVLDVTRYGVLMSNHDTSSYTLKADSFCVVVANAREGNDTANLDSTCDDAAYNFIGATGFGLMSCKSWAARANGFDSVTAATRGNQTTARLYDTPGDDKLDVRADRVEFQGDGHTTRLLDFGSVGVYSTSGNDAARFYDSEWDDEFIANPTIASMYTPIGVTSAWNFPNVYAYRTSGKGNDVAAIQGTTGDDTLEAYGNASGIGSHATLTGTVNNRTYLLRVENFPTVSAISGGGQDAATLRGTAAVDAVLATPGLVQLTGNCFRHSAAQFSIVNVEIGGGPDTASFVDSPATDRLVAAADWAQMSYADRTVRLSGLSELARIVAGLHGNDEKREEAHDYALTFLWLP